MAADKHTRDAIGWTYHAIGMRADSLSARVRNGENALRGERDMMMQTAAGLAIAMERMYTGDWHE